MSDEKIYYCPRCRSLEIINDVELSSVAIIIKLFFNKNVFFKPIFTVFILVFFN